jgi:nucleotide-binding universal stress UspA family protein
MAPCTVNAYFMLHRFQTIVHPTDFSDTSALAFAHALRIALAMRSLLYIVHIAESKCPDEYDGFPQFAMCSHSGS